MIEEYGTLSEEELLEEIMGRIEEGGEIDATDLEFKFDEDQLIITGNLQTEEELEALTSILGDYLDVKDYSLEVEIAESPDFKRDTFTDQDEFEDEEDVDEEDFDSEGLEEVDEDDMEFEEEDEDDFDDNKW